MPRSARNGKFVLTNSKKDIRAIVLGYDYATEHERGFHSRRAYVKTNKDGDVDYDGKQGRVWVQTPEIFRYCEYEDYKGLVHYRAGDIPFEWFDGWNLNRESYFAWDTDDFAVMTRDKKMQLLLKDMYDAAQKDPSELCFLTGSHVGGGASGLCIGRTRFFFNDFPAMAEQDKINRRRKAERQQQRKRR